MGKLATFKWFTDTYTRGSWESGVSDNMFITSRTNVSATSNKAINYNDLLNPSSYNSNTIGATTNKCVEQTDITNLMRQTNFTVNITKNSKSNGTTDICFTNTDFDSNAAAIITGYPIKLNVTINENTTYNNVNVDYQGSNGVSNSYNSFIINYTGQVSSVRINKVSVFRPNTTASYIVKPQITFNYATGLSVSISGQAANFATVGSVITNGSGSGSGDGGGENTGGRVLTIDSSWKSTDEASRSGLSFDVCWGYVASKEDTNVYTLENPEKSGKPAIYVKDDNKEIGDYIGKYIAFYGETLDISVPSFTSYEVRDWGDTYSLS